MISGPGSAGNRSRVSKMRWPGPAASSNPQPSRESTATSKSSYPYDAQTVLSNCATSTATTATPNYPGSAGSESPANTTTWPDPAASSNPQPSRESTATSKSSYPYDAQTVLSNCATSTATTATPNYPGSAGNESPANRTRWPDPAASPSPPPVRDSTADSKSWYRYTSATARLSYAISSRTVAMPTRRGSRLNSSLNPAPGSVASSSPVSTHQVQEISRSWSTSVPAQSFITGIRTPESTRCGSGLIVSPSSSRIR